jgi:hypothetical protein
MEGEHVGPFNLGNHGLEHARTCQACWGMLFFLQLSVRFMEDPLEDPQTEAYRGNVNPIEVHSFYDEGKRTSETLTMDYHRGANVEVRIARIFNTYGPRMCLDDGQVVSNFIAQDLRKEPLTVYGYGKQTRIFLSTIEKVGAQEHAFRTMMMESPQPGSLASWEFAHVTDRLRKWKMSTLFSPGMAVALMGLSILDPRLWPREESRPIVPP